MAGTPFQDSLRGMVEEDAARRAAEKRATEEFRDGWEKVRREILWPALKEAEEALAPDIRGRFANDNGGTSFEVGSSTYSLRFSADYGKRKIAFTSKAIEPQTESFDLASFDRDLVEAKVRDLLGHFLAHRDA